jgi:type II secretory ATPase GspE/PulE/Tfp pilus assembly ATPase PilB-like protein
MSQTQRRHDTPRLLGELLLEAGVVNGAGLRAGLEAQRLGGGRLGWHLMRLGEVVPVGFHLFLDTHLEGMRPDLMESLRSGEAAGMIPAPLAHHYRMMPVRDDGATLEIALAQVDPRGLLPAVEALTGRRVEPIICPPSFLAESIARHYPAEVEAGVRFRAAGEAELVVRAARRGIAPAGIEALRPSAPASEWLRALLALGLRRRARLLAIEPVRHGGRLRLESDEGEEDLDLPEGPLASVAALVDGLSGAAARGQVLPREGRFTAVDEGRRVAVSALSLPGLHGRTTLLHLREERLLDPTPLQHARALPALVSAVETLASERRGLLVLAGTGPSEWNSALLAVLGLLGERLPRRDVRGGWDEPAPVSLESPADLLVVATPWDESLAPALEAEAAQRVVLAACDAGNAFRAAGALAQGRVGRVPRCAPAGILAARHLEAVCGVCRRPFDFGDLLDLVPEAGPARSGSYATAPGCDACRGSGRLDRVRVLEYLPLDSQDLRRPGRRAALRDRQAEARQPTLLDAVLSEAADGRVDVREVLRLLVHEPR